MSESEKDIDSGILKLLTHFIGRWCEKEMA